MAANDYNIADHARATAGLIHGILRWDKASEGKVRPTMNERGELLSTARRLEDLMRAIEVAATDEALPAGRLTTKQVLNQRS